MLYVAQEGNNCGGLPGFEGRGGGGRRGGWKGEKKTNLKAKRSWSAPRVERGVFHTGEVCACSQQ